MYDGARGRAFDEPTRTGLRPPLGIEADVAPMVAPPSARDDVWQRGGVVAVALALLQQEGPVPVTWDLGFYAGLTVGGVSLAMQDLRAQRR